MSKKSKRGSSKKSNQDGRLNRLYQDDALQKRIKKSRESSRGRISNIFKPGIEFNSYFPKDGDHILDVVPYLAGDNDPATEEGNPTYTFEYLVHRLGPNNTEYICPRMYDKECPACEHREKLKENDDDIYKKWWPKTRNLYNIISYDDKKEKKKGVQVFDVANFYFEKNLVAVSRVPSRGGEEDKTINFVHPKKGKSIAFTIEPAKSKDDFPSYIGFKLIERDYEIDKKLLKSCYQLDQLVQLASYEEIKKAMAYVEKENEEEENNIDVEELLDELSEIKNMKKLIKFCEKHNFEYDEDEDFKKEKKAIKKQIEELEDDDEDLDDDDLDDLDDLDKDDNDGDDDDNDGDDDDGDGDDGDDEEEDDDGDDEEEDEDEEDDLEELINNTDSFRDLKKLVKEHDISVKLKKDKPLKWNKKKTLAAIDD